LFSKEKKEPILELTRTPGTSRASGGWTYTGDKRHELCSQYATC
jgi:hypothetical protein